MPRPEEYEVLILGSGKSGKSLAWHLAGSGYRTAVVGRRWIGGACPNVNCLPSKNEIWSAKVADLVHQAAKFSLVTGPIAIDMGRVERSVESRATGVCPGADSSSPRPLLSSAPAALEGLAC